MAKVNTRAAFLAAPNAAEAFRILNVDGKRGRTYLRKLGKYASKGTGWANMSTKERADVYAHFVPNAPKVTRKSAPKVTPAQADAPAADAS